MVGSDVVDQVFYRRLRFPRSRPRARRLLRRWQQVCHMLMRLRPQLGRDTLRCPCLR